MGTAENSGKSAKAKPRGRAFAKGQSGNPGGRPARTAAELDLIAQCKEKTPRALEVLERIMESAEKDRDRLTAALAIIERAYGKPVQPTDNEHSGAIKFGWLE
jgi:hypothetical protein